MFSRALSPNITSDFHKKMADPISMAVIISRNIFFDDLGHASSQSIGQMTLKSSGYRFSRVLSLNITWFSQKQNGVSKINNYLAAAVLNFECVT